MFLQIDVPLFEALRLLGSAPRLPGEFEEVAERIAVVVVVANRLPFLLGHNLLATRRLGLFDVADRRLVDVAKFGCPVKWSLDGDDRAAAIVRSPAWVLIRPFDNMERPQRIRRHRSRSGERINEALDVLAIPVVGSAGTVLLAPIQIFLEDLGHGQAGRAIGLRRRRLLRITRHKAVEFSFGLVFGRTEIMPLPTNRNEPCLAIFAPPRFWQASHDETLQQEPCEPPRHAFGFARPCPAVTGQGRFLNSVPEFCTGPFQSQGPLAKNPQNLEYARQESNLQPAD